MRKDHKHWSLTIPGSSANLGPGFDCLGLALGIYNRFNFTLQEENYKLTFSDTNSIPEENKLKKNNYVVRAYEHSCRQLKIEPIPFALHSEVGINPAGGMGSSGTAIIAGTAISLIQRKLQKKTGIGAHIWESIMSDVLNISGTIEEHPDNVAPSILGGFVICLKNGRTNLDRNENQSIERNTSYFKYECFKYKVMAEIKCYVLQPELVVKTVESRQNLNTEVSRAEATFNIGHASLLAAAFARGDYGLLKHAMWDKLHENRRDNLYDYRRLKQTLLEAGALGVALSGSGPAVLALCRQDAVKQIQQATSQHFETKNIKYTENLLEVDNHGAKLEVVGD